MKKAVYLCFSLLAVSCGGQEKKTDPVIDTQKKIIQKDTVMEKFNIEEFNKHQENGEWNFTDNEENHVRQIKDREEGYSVEISNNKNIFDIKKYFYTNGVLAQKALQFHGNAFVKGIVTDYDKQGNIIKQTDYDAPFKNYPWEKIKAYMESKNIDLLDPFTQVYRNNENNHPEWHLEWDTKELDKNGNQILMNEEIDGNTGKVLLIYESYFGERVPGEPGQKILYDAGAEKKKQSSVYKTCKGKDYTEAEWVKKEQELWEQYQAKKNRGGFFGFLK
jgi:hypothetical protein